MAAMAEKATAPAAPTAKAAPTARSTLDHKGRNALKASLTKASDMLLMDADTRKEALPVDQAVAFIEMGAYSKARLCLGEALDRVTALGNAEAAALIEETKRELPAEDAKWEVVEPETETEDGIATFDQEPHSTEATVTIKVPAATKTSDVTVVIKRDFLSAKVAGHAKQPHVVYGCLGGNVEVDACAWTLEGEGETRALVVNLEKQTDHPCWKKLFGDAIDYWKDADLEGLGSKLNIDDAGAVGLGPKLNIDDAATTSPVWVPEAVARAAAEKPPQ